MTDVREFLRVCPDGVTFSKSDVLELLDRYDAIEEGTPGQIAKRLGRSAKYWRSVAEAGDIHGAYREESGRWRLPLQGARRHIERKRQQRMKGGFRGPRKKQTATSHAAPVGTARVLPGTVGVAGSATVGRREDRCA